VKNSPPHQDFVPEQSHSKLKEIRKPLEFGSGKKEELQVKDPMEPWRVHHYEFNR
jgi:hypothetical protein